MTLDEDRLQELLNRWEDVREQGRSASEEELCRDCPELLPELRRRTAKLLHIGRFLTGETANKKDELTAAGRYRPVQLHAHGGLGEVFLARDEELGREVALKRIRSGETMDRQRAKLFQFEAEITGRLDHPGVVPVYGLGRDASGRLYYAMRFIRGETLQQALERFHQTYPPGKDHGAKSLAFQKLIRSFLTVCQTIGYAHSQDVIHRDIKPANIMLGHYGETLVVDWGLAKKLPRRIDGNSDTVVLSGSSDTPDVLTKMGDIKGSPAYMSPEQAEGRSDLVGARSDIYGLGATLYTLLAGKPPFADENVYILLNQVKRGEFPPPRQIRGDIPAPLEAICLKAMSLKPAERYATALEMAADLEHWLADDPVTAWREPWTARTQRVVRKHQTLASTLASIVLVALLGISAVAVQQGAWNRTLGRTNKNLATAITEKSDALAQKSIALSDKTAALDGKEAALKEVERTAGKLRLANQAAEKAKDAAQKSAEKARGELYKSLVVIADRSLSDGDRAAAARALDEAPEEYRNIEWRLLARSCAGSKETWRAPGGLVYSVAVSRDGSRVAVADLNGPLRVYHTADGSLVKQLDIVARKVAFLQDNDFLLVQALSIANRPWSDYCESPSPPTTGPLALWCISQDKRLPEYREFVDDFALSPNSNVVAVVVVNWPDDSDKFGQVTSRIEFFDVLKQTLLGSIEDVPGQIARIAFSPVDGRLFVVARQPASLATWSKPAKTTGFNTVNSPTWKSDFPTTGYRLIGWDVAGQGLLQPAFSTASSSNANAADMAIAPDGKQVLVSDRNTINPIALRDFTHSWFSDGHINAFDAKSGEVLTADALPLDVASVPQDPKGKRPRGRAPFFGSAVGAIAISDDGKRLAAVSGTKILVFDMEKQTKIAELWGHVGVPQCLVFDHNSSRLFSAGSDGQTKLWDLDRPQYERVSILFGTGRVGPGMAFSGDSRRMAVCAANGEIEIRDVPARRVLMKVPALWSAAPQEMAAAEKLGHLPGGGEALYGPAAVAGEIRFSPDGRRLIAIYEKRLICVWDISGEQAARLDFLDETALCGDPLRLGLASMTLSRDGRYLATESLYPQDRVYRVIDIASRRLAFTYDKDKFLGWNPEMKFDAASRLFFLKRSYSHAKPRLLAWDLTTGKRTAEGDLERTFAAAAETTPDGLRQVAVAEGLVKIIDRQTGRALLEYAGPDDYTSAVLSPDGNYILAGNYNRVDLLDCSPIPSHAATKNQRAPAGGVP